METINCDLCVIGMGASGLNALNSSAQYLSKKDEVVVIDKRDPSHAIGGMWNSTYDFVRLHQPHSLFTVGNKKWKLKKDPSYLANRNEILTHFKDCYDSLKNKLSIVEKFGYQYQRYEEIEVNGTYEVHITFLSINNDLPTLLVKAKRCIKAFGFNVVPTNPLKLSTNKVNSITPESAELLNSKVANDNKPVYIIGGGKTAMDVAKLLISQNPKIKLNFIIGKGTYFLNRDFFFPTGIKKNWKGKTINQLLIDVTNKYDGDNLDATTEYIKKKYAVTPFEDAKQNLLGLLSTEELQIIKKSIETEVYDYLVDVTEHNDQTFIEYRNGQKQEVSAGSWFINCTGYLYTKQEELEPILSLHQKVLSIQKTSSAIVFTTMGGYFLPHLWFRDKFKEVSVRQFNHLELLKKDKQAFLIGLSAQGLHNLIQFMDALPLHVVSNCGLNFDKWYPLHRQLAIVFDILINKKKYLQKSSDTLNLICTKYGIKHGVIGK